VYMGMGMAVLSVLGSRFSVGGGWAEHGEPRGDGLGRVNDKGRESDMMFICCRRLTWVDITNTLPLSEKRKAHTGTTHTLCVSESPSVLPTNPRSPSHLVQSLIPCPSPRAPLPPCRDHLSRARKTSDPRRAGGAHDAMMPRCHPFSC